MLARLVVRGPDAGPRLMSDAKLHDELRMVGESYLRLAQDRAWLAHRQAEFWAQVARLELRNPGRPLRRPPSGSFAGVHEALSRAKTEAHNPTALLELARAADEEHRPTPVVPDARKEPE